MMPALDLVYRNTTSSRVVTRALVARVYRAALPYLKLRGSTVEFSVIVIGPTRMRALNRKWRHVNKPTDVLTFALPSPTIAGYTAISLGDIFVCPTVVREKARQWDRPERIQMAWTVVHGLLHLVGYDHERSASQAARMATVEQRILKQLAV